MRERRDEIKVCGWDWESVHVKESKRQRWDVKIWMEVREMEMGRRFFEGEILEDGESSDSQTADDESGEDFEEG